MKTAVDELASRYPDKISKKEPTVQVWDPGAELTFSEYIDVVDEVLRDMMLPTILMEKHERRIGETRVLLQKIWRKKIGTRWAQFSNLILQYVTPPRSPALNMEIHDSDVVQFSYPGESYTNTWRRLIAEYSHLITVDVIHSVIRQLPVTKSPTPTIIHRYYLNRPVTDLRVLGAAKSSEIRKFDLTYHVMFTRILVAR